MNTVPSSMETNRKQSALKSARLNSEDIQGWLEKELTKYGLDSSEPLFSSIMNLFSGPQQAHSYSQMTTGNSNNSNVVTQFDDKPSRNVTVSNLKKGKKVMKNFKKVDCPLSDEEDVRRNATLQYLQSTTSVNLSDMQSLVDEVCSRIHRFSNTTMQGDGGVGMERKSTTIEGASCDCGPLENKVALSSGDGLSASPGLGSGCKGAGEDSGILSSTPEDGYFASFSIDGWPEDQDLASPNQSVMGNKPWIEEKHSRPGRESGGNVSPNSDLEHDDEGFEEDVDEVEEKARRGVKTGDDDDDDTSSVASDGGSELLQLLTESLDTFNQEFRSGTSAQEVFTVCGPTSVWPAPVIDIKVTSNYPSQPFYSDRQQVIFPSSPSARSMVDGVSREQYLPPNHSSMCQQYSHSQLPSPSHRFAPDDQLSRRHTTMRPRPTFIPRREERYDSGTYCDMRWVDGTDSELCSPTDHSPSMPPNSTAFPFPPTSGMPVQPTILTNRSRRGSGTSVISSGELCPSCSLPSAPSGTFQPGQRTWGQSNQGMDRRRHSRSGGKVGGKATHTGNRCASSNWASHGSGTNTGQSSDWLFTQARAHSLPPVPQVATNSRELEDQWMTGHVEPVNRQKSRHITTQPVDKWRRACSFYLRGHCKKEDCEFAHDLTKVTCKFWESGECFKGPTCPFLHGYTSDNEEATPGN